MYLCDYQHDIISILISLNPLSLIHTARLYNTSSLVIVSPLISQSLSQQSDVVLSVWCPDTHTRVTFSLHHTLPFLQSTYFCHFFFRLSPPPPNMTSSMHSLSLTHMVSNCNLEGQMHTYIYIHKYISKLISLTSTKPVLRKIPR